MEMESFFRDRKDEALRQEFCEELASKFSSSKHHVGKSIIKWEQVQHWFQDKCEESAAEFTSSSDASIFPSNAVVASNAAQHSSLLTLKELANSVADNETGTSHKSKAERIAELSELVFEAQSAKDGAWFDVASFLNYRLVNMGELEVRVRFAGFSCDQDEWVNVRRAVRERSIPLEASECEGVKVGDLVLCFRENDDHALYCDAHVVKIQRKSHDNRACRCIFGVRYVIDNAEEKVTLERLCCRPA